MKLVVVLACSIAACARDEISLPPPGHVLLHIDTDAPVAPPRGSARDPQAPAPLFDRLLVDVFRPGDIEPCTGCVAELDLTEDVLEAGGSLALVPAEATADMVVRVRMFSSLRRIEGRIAPEATVEVVARLPDVASEGRVEAGVFLPTDAVGYPLGTLAEPIDADRGPFGPSRVGTWGGAQRLDCSGSAPPGAVCVPGGAFWMGHPLARGLGIYDIADRQRLVVLEPFFIDVSEATVASFRQTGLSVVSYVQPWSGKSTGGGNADADDWCTYTLQPDPARESLPLACVSWEGAQAYCRARGGQLPTEAQFEYVAGALESRLYVWGTDPPTCDDAIWSRGSNYDDQMFVCYGSLPPGDIGGPLPLPPDAQPQALAPPRARDAAVLPAGAVFDLAGNLTEWVRDFYQHQDEACWSNPTTNVFHDPVCTSPGIVGDLRTSKGASWTSYADELRASRRNAGPPNATIINAGVRCVWPATP